MPAQSERPARRVVLVVEDDDLLRRACAMALRQAQYVVLTAAEGATALEVLRDLEQPPDVLIVDMRLPDMNGTTLVRRAGLPASVLYVSADERCLTQARLAARATDAVLAKPFSLDALRAHVERLLGAETDPEPDVA